VRGFDKAVWVQDGAGADEQKAWVRFTHASPNGDEGYPGSVSVAVTYSLLLSQALQIDYEATSDAATPINLTNHAYWNLSGAGSATVLDHELMLPATHYTPTDDTLIPTGVIAPVGGTPLDFTRPWRIGARIAELDDTGAMGYDHNFVLREGPGALLLAARLRDPDSGRVLEILTTEPGIQFYSGNFLDGDKGKAGKAYGHRSALCLETQHFPDSVNHKTFPNTILRPGQAYRSTTVHRFGLQ
jgi:aldose 1-epimerase